MSSIRPRLAPFAAGLALALVLAGCGGGSGGSEPLSKQEYRKQFNAIGKRFLTQVGSLQTRLSRTKDPGKRAAALDAATAAFSKLADRLDKIEPPKAIAGVQRTFVGKLRVIASDLGKVKQALASKRQNKIQAAALKLQSDGSAAKQAGSRIDNFVK